MFRWLRSGSFIPVNDIAVVPVPDVVDTPRPRAEAELTDVVDHPDGPVRSQERLRFRDGGYSPFDGVGVAK